MIDPDDNRLQGMGLVRLEDGDRFIENEYEWKERKTLYDALVKTDLFDVKPKGVYFEVAEDKSEKANIPCNLVIPVLLIEATIPGGLSDKSPKKIAAEYTWAMAEAAEWSKEQLHYEEIKVKGEHLAIKYASDPETYSVPNYYEYIPVQVKNAENDYKQKYLEKHIQTHTQLTIEMISCYYRMFKCNTALKRQESIHNHYKKVHLLPSGCYTLRKREIIDVHISLEFKIPEITEFQSLGPNKQAALLDRVYTHCVARGMFEETSNRNEATLQRSRSNEFLTEMKKASSPNY